MPHHESPPMAAAVVAKTADPSQAVPPTADEVSAIVNTCLTSKTSQAALDSAYALTGLLESSVGFRGLKSYGILDEVRKAAVNKKDAAKKEGAMFVLGALFERMPQSQPISEVVFFLQEDNLVPVCLDCLADKNSTIKESAQYALDALFKNLRAEALVYGLLPVLTKYLSKTTGKWQGTVGAFSLITQMSDKAKIGMLSLEEEREKDILRESMGKKLASLIPVVEGGMHDLKAEVAKQAVKCMNSLSTLLQNDDVTPKIPLLIKAMENPSAASTQKAIHALSMTTFVAIVTAPVLAMLTPLLERSLNNPSTNQEVLRQTVVVVENLTKLVHDPIEARNFLPKLRPGVQGVKDRASLPEVRELATRALDVIKHAMGEDADNVSAVTRTSPEDVATALDKEIATNGGITDYPGDDEVWKHTRSYIAEMVSEDINERALERIVKNIEPYIKPLTQEGSSAHIAENVHQYFVEEDERKFGKPVVEDDGETEIVNATFSLGYGGMLLLSHTNLRLLKGHRYGLCGRNGAGKSTLMRSIAEGKLEGFPPQDEVKTCFVEHNQGEDADLSILEYISNDPRFADESREHISEVLEEVGFTAGPEGRQSEKVGSLSGGWKMKLALARAMLMRADVFLLDEPTNHLDVANIAWVQDFLKKNTEITSLIVSHDSSFLDEVCTDIYHYEQKKLVCYKGNLADFVRQKPEASAYYTLSTSQVQFKFPPPGILTGVKSNTRAILRMSGCSFTYPGAPKASLSDVTCSLTLSSRVAIIGANGAGKSTLIKVLTGEVIPQIGKVEKHPNLRIGYIKQHALEHVEMHMEKTPNQYLQWRYANGDDREVLMKQTRILTESDKAQMDKDIDIGDGKGARKLEALIGRQKYKKSFQYEV